MIVELKDKGIEVEFPDDMSPDRIKDVIKRKFYSESAQAKPATLSQELSEADMETLSSPMPAIPLSVMKAIDQGATNYAPELGFAAGAMTNVPLVPSLAAMAGKQYQGIRRGFEGQPPPTESEWNQVTSSMPMPIRTQGALKEGGLGLAGELIPGVAKATLPIAGSVLQEAAKGYGLPQLAYKSKPWIENFVNLVPGGRWVSERYKNKLYQWSLNERDNILREFGDNLPPEINTANDVGEFLKGVAGRHGEKYDEFVSAGRIAGKSEDEIYREFLSRAMDDRYVPEATKQAWKEEAKKQAGKEVELKIPMPNASEFAKKIAPEVDDKTKGVFLKLQGGYPLTTREIEQILGGKRMGIDRESKELLKPSIMQDLEAFDQKQGTQLKVLREEADNLFREMLGKWMKNPSFITALKAYEPSLSLPGRPGTFMLSERPDLVLKRIFTTSKPEKVSEILNEMPTELKNQSIAQWLQNEISACMNADNTVILPFKWQQRFDGSVGPMLEKIAPNAFKRAKTWTDILHNAGEHFPGGEATQGAFQRIISSGGTPYIGLGATIAGSHIMFGKESAGGPGFWMGVAVMNGLPTVMAYSFLGPAGKAILRRAVARAPSRIASGEAALTMGGE